jgi:hypothetical protein
MTDTITADDHGKVRIFQLDPQLEMEIGQSDDYDWLERALGAKIVNKEDVQIVAEMALKDLGLAQFLVMGHGIAEADIKPQMATLNALKGSVAIVRSGAFGGVAFTLRPDSEAKLIATFTEEGVAPAPLVPLTSEGSAGILAPDPPAKRPKSDARVGGMVATVALLLMGLLVWLMIWIAS